VGSSTIIISATQGVPGIQGLQGVAGVSNIIATVGIAGETIGGHRGVCSSSNLIYYADNTNLLQVNRLIGISVQAVDIGQQLNIQSAGEITGFTGLTAGDILYLQTNGVINTTLPTSGFIQQVGIALTSTTILLNIQPSIVIG